MSNNSVKKTISVALGICLVCSVLVSGTAVLLHDRQQENRRLEKIRNILTAGDLLSEADDPERVFAGRIDQEIIDLRSGRPLPESDYGDMLNPADFNMLTTASSDSFGIRIPDDKDIAGIRRKPAFMLVYKVRTDSSFSTLILPVYGKGLWSTMFGFLALDSDLRTIRGFTVYEHGETPGLGGEVDNPAWKRKWIGKHAYDAEGNPVIRVIKGTVQADDPEAERKIDGLSGATLTTQGVDNLIRFWLGDNGYGPYIRQLKSKGNV